MRNKNILQFIIALIILISGFFFISDNFLTPYVSFSYAKNHSKETVQIFGKRLIKKNITQEKDSIFFTLVDNEKKSFKVQYNGIAPSNFNHANEVVVIGKYIAETGLFLADTILVKCPSKYKKNI